MSARSDAEACAVGESAGVGGESASGAVQLSSAAEGPDASTLASRPEAAERGGPSSLDTTDITRQPRQQCAQQVGWLQDLAGPTQRHRERLATGYREKGRARRAHLRNEGAYEHEVEERTKWYRDRERGQLERIERVQECGSRIMVISCQSCGVIHERSRGCRSGLYCFRCRGAIAAEKRGKFLAAREALMVEAQDEGLLRKYRRGGSYGERFLTLTVPHLPTDTIASRIARATGAWVYFLKLLNQHFQEYATNHVEWLRVRFPGAFDQRSGDIRSPIPTAFDQRSGASDH